MLSIPTSVGSFCWEFQLEVTIKRVQYAAYCFKEIDCLHCSRFDCIGSVTELLLHWQPVYDYRVCRRCEVHMVNNVRWSKLSASDFQAKNRWTVPALRPLPTIECLWNAQCASFRVLWLRVLVSVLVSILVSGEAAGECARCVLGVCQRTSYFH